MELRDTHATIGRMLPFLAQKVIICKICILLSHVCVRLMLCQLVIWDSCIFETLRSVDFYCC